jgi:aerobic carbon-monoxide dehydrogenase medium subunit
VFPRRFNYLAPRDVDGVFDALATYPESKVLAGGQSLIPIMKMRLCELSHVIDLRYLPWNRVYEDDDGMHIGALVTHRALEEDRALGARLPIIPEAAHHLGDLQVRGMGTFGGALAEADPAGDWPAVMIALDASVVIASKAGRRTIPIVELFPDPYTTSLEHTELIEEAIVPAAALRGKGAYMKLERRAGSFAIAGIAVQIRLGENGTVERAGIGIAGAGLTPLRAVEAEKCLVGKALNLTLIREAAQLAREASSPFDDLRGTAEYKREMVGVMTERTIELAQSRLQGLGKVTHAL